MAHAYTPGLRVSELTALRKNRRLPIKGEVMVKVGDEVTSDTIVARTFLPGNVQLINVASKLGIPPEDLPPVMAKGEGEKVVKGESLATSRGFFGVFKSTVPSPCEGTIESVSTVTGQVILREPPSPIAIDAYVDGRVVEVFESEGVAIEVVGTFIQGIFGVGGERTGILTVRTDDPSRPLTPDDIRDDDSGRIIVGGSHVTWEGLQKAMKVGAHGVVVGGFDDPDLKRLLGKDLGVAITGHENVPTSIVLTEGFGEIAMAKGTFELLRKRDGRKASINGATQIRAGVIRPEIVIPIEEAKHSDEIAAAAQGTGLEIGSTIRAIRAPYFGRLGAVSELPNELRKMESESMVRVLKVKFADGEEALLPRANVEMIER